MADQTGIGHRIGLGNSDVILRCEKRSKILGIKE